MLKQALSIFNGTYISLCKKHRLKLVDVELGYSRKTNREEEKESRFRGTVAFPFQYVG